MEGRRPSTLTAVVSASYRTQRETSFSPGSKESEEDLHLSVFSRCPPTDMVVSFLDSDTSEIVDAGGRR